MGLSAWLLSLINRHQSQNAGLVSQRGEAGFLPRSWVSLMLPASTPVSACQGCFYRACVLRRHIYQRKVWTCGESTERFLGITQERGWQSKTSSPVVKGCAQCPGRLTGGNSPTLSGNEPDESFYQHASRKKPWKFTFQAGAVVVLPKFSNIPLLFHRSFAGDKRSHRKQGFCAQSQRMSCKDCWGKQTYYPGRQEIQLKISMAFSFIILAATYQKSGSSQADWAGNGANQRWNVHWSPRTNQLVPRRTHKMLPASPSAHNAAFNKNGLVFRSSWLRQ